MISYYVSIELMQFFFTTDHIQMMREGSTIDRDFVPVTRYTRNIQAVRESMLSGRYKEIPNPNPKFSLQTVHALIPPSLIVFCQGGSNG